MLQFVRGIFAHLCWIQNLSCSTVRGRRCLILLFVMHHAFSIDNRSGMQAGQSSTGTVCLRSCCRMCKMSLGWNIHWLPGKTLSIDGSICFSVYISALMVPHISHICKFFNAVDTDFWSTLPRLPWIFSQYYVLQLDNVKLLLTDFGTSFSSETKKLEYLQCLVLFCWFLPAGVSQTLNTFQWTV